MNALSWKSAWADKFFRQRLMLSIVLLALVLSALFFILGYAERRTGVVIERGWFNETLSPKDFSIFIFLCTYFSVVAGVFLCVRKPLSFLLLVRTYLILSFLRCITLLVVPLAPPEKIIPLNDPLLHGTFYSGRPNLCDLFFSGHVATIVMFALLVQQKGLRILLSVIACAAGIMLVWQRVHYAADVVAAPLFSFAAFALGRRWISAEFS